MTRSTIWLFLVRTTSFKLHTRECLGEPGFERKPKNSGVNGLESLPPAGPEPDQAHLCFLFLSEQMSKTEKLYQWEGKDGQVSHTSFFKRRNSRLLYLLSVEINKVLSLQICWYDGLNDMTKEENGQMPSRLARVGSLCRLPSGHSSPLLPRSMELRSPVLR